MRKIIVEAEVSIDGVMGGENLDFWQQIFSFHSADVAEYLNDLLFMPDALLLGRKTYEGFAQVWPTRQGKDADRVNAMPKYVASRTLKEPLEWNATLIEGDAVEGVRRLKDERDGDLLLIGCGELARQLAADGLIDEFRFWVHPIVQGSGARPFQGE